MEYLFKSLIHSWRAG